MKRIESTKALQEKAMCVPGRRRHTKKRLFQPLLSVFPIKMFIDLLRTASLLPVGNNVADQAGELLFHLFSGGYNLFMIKGLIQNARGHIGDAGNT